MSRRSFGVVILAVILAAGATFASQTAPDLTGTWSGTFKKAEDPNADTAHMVLKHSGKELTGTAGPSPQQQLAITKGVVAQTKTGTTATFDVTDGGGPVIHFELQLIEGHLKGTAKAEQGEKKLSAVVDVQRAK